MSETTPETIQDRVLRVIATTKRIPLDSVHPESTFEELGIDSLDRLNILFDLESEFDIEINDEDAKRVSNINEMVQGITLLIDAKAAGVPPESLLTGAPAAQASETSQTAEASVAKVTEPNTTEALGDPADSDAKA